MGRCTAVDDVVLGGRKGAIGRRSHRSVIGAVQRRKMRSDEIIHIVQMAFGNDGSGSPHAFFGGLKDQFLPDWAAEKLAELKGMEQTQSEHPAMGDMTMK